MRYPAAIESGDAKHSFGVIVPDLKGCFSAGETLEEAIANAKEAIELWINEALDADEDIPAPSPLSVLTTRKDLKGHAFVLVKVDAEMLSDDKERVNISLPKRVLKRLDSKAKKAHLSRSAFIAEMALRASSAEFTP